MADKIKLLPDYVANQIAAGEVVNRPSSVVKEMLENAVDAGAQNVTVNFRDGGSSLIQIIDDGVGMSPIDARLAFDRHATSKISDVEDIYRLATFGFRGEALASIASVAEVELRTRTGEDELGTKIEIHGGKFVSQAPVNTPVGSQFIVKNLFYNLPARKRFIENTSKESRQIAAEFQRVALVNPGVAFTLYNSDSLVSKLPAATLRQRVVGVAGSRMAKDLLDVKADTSIIKISGFAGRPASARQSNRDQFLFVNGRFFKSPYFHKAVVGAYEKLIPGGTQPSYFIYLTVDPAKIDVNVHPQKTEVKFADGTDIWQIINAAVRETLAKAGAVPQMDFDLDTSVEIPVRRQGVVYKEPEIKANPDFNPFTRYGDLPAGRGSRADISDFVGVAPKSGALSSLEWDSTMEEEGAGGFDRSVMEFIAGEEASQGRLEITPRTKCSGAIPVGAKYFAVAAEAGLVIVDVRRAREAILYDRYLTMLGNGSSVSQQLLFPEKVTMSMDDYSLLEENAAELADFGFELAFDDELTVEVTGVPADLTASAPAEMLYSLIDTLRDEGQEKGEMKRRSLAAAMARIGSRRGTGSTSQDELTTLWEQLCACQCSNYTPGGSPTLAVVTEDEIEKKLRRQR